MVNHQNHMKWSTHTTYVDLDTGEEIHKKKIKSGEYLILKKVKRKSTNYDNKHIQRNFIAHCRKNNQQTLDFQKIPNGTIQT